MFNNCDVTCQTIKLHLLTFCNIFRKTSNKRPAGNKFQTCLRPGCCWRQAFNRGI